MKLTRRTFIHTTGAAIAGIGIPSLSKAGSIFDTRPKHEICLFSKHLQYLDFNEMSDIVSRIGFDGIDMTVRPGGHIEPENVERDLPEALKAARNVSLTVPMMTTSITDPDDKISQKVLKVAADNGILYYRMGEMDYNFSYSIEENLEKFKKVFRKFEAINQEYGIHGDYQNHWGRKLGAPVWDLYNVLNGFDPQWIGCQYDIRHAVVEGGGSWILGMKALGPYINTSAMKDFHWVNYKGRWIPVSVPLGTGMVNFTGYFEEFKQLKNAGPMSLHYEYGMGNAKSRDDQNLTDKDIIDFYKPDLDELKRMLAADV